MAMTSGPLVHRSKLNAGEHFSIRKASNLEPSSGASEYALKKQSMGTVTVSSSSNSKVTVKSSTTAPTTLIILSSSGASVFC